MSIRLQVEARAEGQGRTWAQSMHADGFNLQPLAHAERVFKTTGVFCRQSLVVPRPSVMPVRADRAIVAAAESINLQVLKDCLMHTV